MAAGVASDEARVPSRRRRLLFENIEAYLFLAPALILIGLFHVGPGIAAFVMSLTR